MADKVGDREADVAGWVLQQLWLWVSGGVKGALTSALVGKGGMTASPQDASTHPCDRVTTGAQPAAPAYRFDLIDQALR